MMSHFGKMRITFEARIHRTHRRLAQGHPFLIDRTAEVDEVVETFSGHAVRPGKHGVL